MYGIEGVAVTVQWYVTILNQGVFFDNISKNSTTFGKEVFEIYFH